MGEGTIQVGEGTIQVGNCLEEAYDKDPSLEDRVSLAS